MLPFQSKRVRGLVSLAHDGSFMFGQIGIFWNPRVSVKVFRSKFKAMSFQGLHWLQKVGSGKASFGVEVV